jgi:hypothetical protein
MLPRTGSAIDRSIVFLSRAESLALETSYIIHPKHAPAVRKLGRIGRAMPDSADLIEAGEPEPAEDRSSRVHLASKLDVRA